MRATRRMAMAVTATVGFFVLVMAQPAAADTYSWSTSVNARGQFKPYGDAFVVCDMKADGRGAYGVVYIDSPWNPRLIELRDRNGSGNSCASWSGQESVPENVFVEHQACDLRDGFVLANTCGFWVQDRT